MNKIAQLTQLPLASNPANGINNIPLSGGQSSNNDPQKVMQTLDDISKASPNNLSQYISPLENYIANSDNENIKQKMTTILNALSLTNDPTKQTVDPSTNKKDPTAQELAMALKGEIQDMITQSERNSNVYNAYRIAQQLKQKKKNPRGNPFRVLMGQVGKLLDHGMEKRDIVRYLVKKNFFSKETIERCVDVVKDYNKKNYRKHMAPETEEDINERLSMRLSAKNIESIYDIKPNYEKRSTAELMARATWLLDLLNFNDDNHNEGRKVADKKGASAELKLIREALTKRGFDKTEIEFKDES